MQADNLPIY